MTRAELAGMAPADRLAAAREGRVADVLAEGVRPSGQRLAERLGLDAAAVAGMSPEALLAAARAKRAA
ncbi:hypothetical protein [Rhodococcus koreensis]|uniref:hypothetical protein n=1 Tax=Rhodococcus koreensis TaxID=99653 RepID=UPI003672A8E0